MTTAKYPEQVPMSSSFQFNSLLFLLFEASLSVCLIMWVIVEKISRTDLPEPEKKKLTKGVTMTTLLAKATTLALVKHHVVNLSCKDGRSFTYTSRINIAVAEAMDGGLLTPMLQDADKVDIYTLSRKWKELVDKVRAKQLQPQEYNTCASSYC